MKNLVIGLLLYAALPVLAQEETLIKGKVHNGGFGGPVVKFTEIKDEFGVFVGGRGGWIINHTFVIGGGGYGLVNETIETGTSAAGIPTFLTMGYAGLELEYIKDSDRLTHFSILALIGGGGIDELEKGAEHSDSFNGDAFFVFEPAVNFELNVTTFFRLCLSGSFRFIAGANFRDFRSEDLHGPSAALTLKFGKF